jgi:hypothetical protein
MRRIAPFPAASGADVWYMVEVRIRDHAFRNAFAKLPICSRMQRRKAWDFQRPGEHDAPSVPLRQEPRCGLTDGGVPTSVEEQFEPKDPMTASQRAVQGAWKHQMQR